MPVYLDADTLSNLLQPNALINALRRGFASAVDQPARTHLDIGSSAADSATLLLMPAWNDHYLGVKTATIHPANNSINLPSVHASYLLMEAATGRDLAILEGTTLTRLRTAAASALASTFLSRPDASTLLLIGAGSLAAPLIEAHCSVRPIDRVMVWNRNDTRRAALEAAIDGPIEWVGDLDQAVTQAHIISSATLSTEALIRHTYVRPGTHVDLVGAYKSGMRESDAALISSSSVFVDTHEGARHEAGDLLAAASELDWSFDRIEADLKALCTGEHSGRASGAEITVFKSVGASLEDLVAAQLAWELYSS
jgi:ornithine cyclodeaminase